MLIRAKKILMHIFKKVYIEVKLLIKYRIKREVNRKMKGGGLITFIVVLGLICAIGIVAADDLIIGREVEIEGSGVINTELRIDTCAYHPGVKLGEDLSTPGGGYNGLSNARYAASFEVGMYNYTGNMTSDLGYMSNVRTLNAKRSLYLSDYTMGAIMGFKSIGDAEQDIEMYTDNSGMSADYSGKILGRMKMFNKVIDIDDHHVVIVSDVINMAGNYTYKWSAYDERVVYPEDEVDADYLGCP